MNRVYSQMGEVESNLKDTEMLEPTENVLRVEITDIDIVYTGSNCELFQVQKCKWCAKNYCYDTATEHDKENYYGAQVDE